MLWAGDSHKQGVTVTRMVAQYHVTQSGSNGFQAMLVCAQAGTQIQVPIPMSHEAHNAGTRYEVHKLFSACRLHLGFGL
jgi:hypothetical protein